MSIGIRLAEIPGPNYQAKKNKPNTDNKIKNAVPYAFGPGISHAFIANIYPEKEKTRPTSILSKFIK